MPAQMRLCGTFNPSTALDFCGQYHAEPVPPFPHSIMADLDTLHTQ
jgi:hypothetical protein